MFTVFQRVSSRRMPWNNHDWGDKSFITAYVTSRDFGEQMFPFNIISLASPDCNCQIWATVFSLPNQWVRIQNTNDGAETTHHILHKHVKTTTVIPSVCTTQPWDMSKQKNKSHQSLWADVNPSSYMSTIVYYGCYFRQVEVISPILIREGSNG